MSHTDFSALEERIGHVFAQRALLVAALTHPSLAGQERGVEHNQRLEFLGDAVLSLCVSEWLYRTYPQLPEGQLTRLRAILVQESTLAECAQELQLAPLMRLSRGEHQSGGAQKASTLSDAIEALIAAVYLDGGLEEARRFVLAMLTRRVEKALQGSYRRDCKSELQERVRAAWPACAPEYEIIAEWGPAHERMFRACVRFGGEERGTGEGNSKKLAEQNAAQEALAHFPIKGEVEA